MQNNSTLIKEILHNSIAEGLVNEIVTRSSRYYYFLGKTISWEQELAPPFPIDSFAYELDTRNEIITMKEIKPTDAALVVPRVDWAADVVYDKYDDQYSSEVQGIDLISGGESYSADPGSEPKVYIGTAGARLWNAGSYVSIFDFIKVESTDPLLPDLYYSVKKSGYLGATAPNYMTNGIPTADPSLAVLDYFNAFDGGGSGASAVARLPTDSSQIMPVVGVDMVTRGIGYTSPPSVLIAGTTAVKALAQAVVNKGSSTGTQRLEDAAFYVMTDEHRVYSCIDNNNGGTSTVKPIGTTVDPIPSADGYIWKYMYTVPIALRVKFLTEDYLPVVTALRNQFYSNGNIQTVRIDQPGFGYASGSITVNGDGYLEADPIYLSQVKMTGNGFNYTAVPAVEFEPPFPGAVVWQASGATPFPLFMGTTIEHQGNYYEVVVAGDAGPTGPAHKYGIVANGSASLNYIGTIAAGEAELDIDGTISGITMSGIIAEATMLTGGSGYEYPPEVTILGAGLGATAIAVLQNGAVSKITITDGGSGYDNAVAFTEIRVGARWEPSVAVLAGQQIQTPGRLYTVTQSGLTGATAPNHIGGIEANGTAMLKYAGARAEAYASVKYGAGYSKIPLITIESPSGVGIQATAEMIGAKSEAKLIPIFSQIALDGSGGQLIGVQIDNGGVGYTRAHLNITGAGPGPGNYAVGLKASATADLSSGDISTLQSNVELMTVDGRIMSIPVISGGYGYMDGSTTITIDGDGVGATAEAVIGVVDPYDPLLRKQYIKQIKVTNQGAGYRWARIVINGEGFGATARAIISPYGGHGKFALNNLCARTLMFYTNISGDKNHGFDVNNDYRQLGIIKNPAQYGNTNNLTNILASACWVVAGNIDTTFFKPDLIVRESVTNRRFRIVSNTGSSTLLQSLDNYEPKPNDLFIANDGAVIRSFRAAQISPPSADKYSGDMLFIDNKIGFTPSVDQAVTLRTVIRF